MRLIAFVIMFYSNFIFGQDSATVQSFKIYSNILKEERYFQVYVPSSSAKKLEVVYVLDGQAQFKTVVNVLKQLGDYKKIVVGIGNIWLRDRDYTISHVKSSAVTDSAAAAVSGGAPQFVAHLEKEVIPYINSNFPADTSRMIVGHSFGGLVAM